MAEMTIMDFRIKFNEKLDDLAALNKTKSEIYGTTGLGELGAKGEFLQIHKKYQRLKRLVWEESSVGDGDTIEDTLLDLASYAIMMLIVQEAVE